MRIALFSWETLHSISVGGVGVHVSELGAALARRGHEVRVFTRRAQHQTHYAVIEGVHYHRCDFELNPNFVDEIDNMCRAFAKASYEVEDSAGKFDIVHAHDWLAANAVVWFKEGRPRKGVLSMHSTEFGRNGNRHFGGQAQRVADHEWKGCYTADRVITVSHLLREEVATLYQAPMDKLTTIDNGVSSLVFDRHCDPEGVKRSYGLGKMDPTILFVGRMVVQKGPDIFVRTMPAVLKYYPAAKYVMVGDGHMKYEVEQLAHSMGCGHAIRMLGHKGGADLVNLFMSSDIVCVPSRNEPFGIVILEAWSAYKPVVATKRGGPAEFVWHGVNGLQVDDNPDSVAWGLCSLLANHENARWMGCNGRLAVEAAFSWDRIAEQTENVYAGI